MSRIARRLKQAALQPGRPPTFDPAQRHLETALRGRTARKARAHLRRLDPVVLQTPRWSCPQGFLEDLALDLAVGEPGIGCRTVSFRPVAGRSLPEVWQFTLGVFAQLGRPGWVYRPPMAVVARLGFRSALRQLLDDAHESSRYPVALLAHGAEHLPMSVLEDISEVWRDYADAALDDRRCGVLMAGAAGVSALSLSDGPVIELLDYGEEEAAGIDRLVRFTGGVPALVAAVGDGMGRLGGLPADDTALLRCLGPVADELRGAVDIANADDDLSDRLQMLLPGWALPEIAEVDEPLFRAGLLRHVRAHGEPHVGLRTPAIASFVA